MQHLGEEDVLAAAVGLQRDAGIMLSNLQILSQFVRSMHRMSSEMLTLGMGSGVPFRRGRGFFYDTEGAPVGRVHGCDGLVASTDWSGWSRAGASFIL